MIALGSAWAAAVIAFDFDPPNSSGGATTVISILAGTSWFRRNMDRPMSQRERLSFATGVTLLNAAVPIAFVAALVSWFGLPLSVASFDLVLEGGKGTLLEPAFAWLMLFILGAVFAGAYFAAGRRPRKPTRADKAIKSDGVA
jgi:hypothetical protein